MQRRLSVPPTLIRDPDQSIKHAQILFRRHNKTMAPTQPAHLEPSELGAKQYWEDYYSRDLASTPSAEIELDGWFDDVGAAGKILLFLTDPDLNFDLNSTCFIDLGTGNGDLLFRLRDEGGFDGPMVGKIGRAHV